MNQCKRGPNTRIIQNGNVLIYPQHMNDIEQKRKSFQGITSDDKVRMVWGMAKSTQLNDDEDVNVNAIDTGTSVDKLTDIMPVAKLK